MFVVNRERFNLPSNHEPDFDEGRRVVEPVLPADLQHDRGLAGDHRRYRPQHLREVQQPQVRRHRR